MVLATLHSFYNGFLRMKIRIIVSVVLISVGNSDCNDGQVELWGECYSINITNLTIINSGLTGEIPSEIGLMTDLEVIRLKYLSLIHI